jgi:hypothetical protein
VDTVEPHLLRVDLLVPECSVGGARVGPHLRAQGFDGLAVADLVLALCLFDEPSLRTVAAAGSSITSSATAHASVPHVAFRILRLSVKRPALLVA